MIDDKNIHNNYTYTCSILADFKILSLATVEAFRHFRLLAALNELVRFSASDLKLETRLVFSISLNRTGFLPSVLMVAKEDDESTSEFE